MSRYLGQKHRRDPAARNGGKSGRQAFWCSGDRPSRPGTKRRAATARPALKADSTKATAIACHSTIAARGALNVQVARARVAGTGPTSTSARSAKADADTRDSLPQVVPAPFLRLYRRPHRAAATAGISSAFRVLPLSDPDSRPTLSRTPPPLWYRQRHPKRGAGKPLDPSLM